MDIILKRFFLSQLKIGWKTMYFIALINGVSMVFAISASQSIFSVFSEKTSAFIDLKNLASDFHYFVLPDRRRRLSWVFRSVVHFSFFPLASKDPMH